MNEWEELGALDFPSLCKIHKRYNLKKETYFGSQRAFGSHLSEIVLLDHMSGKKYCLWIAL